MEHLAGEAWSGEREVTFEDVGKFLEQYDQNIRHGGMFYSTDTPPPAHTRLRILLRPPLGLDPIRLSGTVVYCFPAGVGVELNKLLPETQEQLQCAVQRCRQAGSGAGKIGSKAGKENPRTRSARDPEADGLNRIETDITARIGAVGTPPAQTTAKTGAEEAEIETAVPAPSVATTARETDEASARQGTLAAEREGANLLTAPDKETQSILAHTQTITQNFDLEIEDEGPSGEQDPIADALKNSGPSSEDTLSTDRIIENVPFPKWFGALEDRSVLDVMSMLAQEKANGLLSVTSSGMQARFMLNNGFVIRARQDPVKHEFKLGQILLLQGVIGVVELETAVAEANRRNCRLGRELVRRGAVSSALVLDALSTQLRLLVTDVLERTTGRFVFYDGIRVRKGPPVDPVHPLQIAYRTLVSKHRGVSKDDVYRVDMDYLSRYLHPKEDLEKSRAELGLTRDEDALLKLAVGSEYCLDEIYLLSRLSRSETHAIIAALHELGLVTFEYAMWPPARLRLLIAELPKKISEIRGQPPMAVLQLGYPFNTQQLIDAYFRLSLRYDCFDTTDGLPLENIKMSVEILSRLDKAYEAGREYLQRQAERNALPVKREKRVFTMPPGVTPPRRRYSVSGLSSR